MNAPGDFYAEDGYCLSCGVPESIAPNLIGRDEQSENGTWHCYWKRQPQNQEEVDLAIQILQAQELDCHRYAGKDRAILKQLPSSICDAHIAKSLSSPTAFDFSRGKQFQLNVPSESGGLLSRLLRKIFSRQKS